MRLRQNHNFVIAFTLFLFISCTDTYEDDTLIGTDDTTGTYEDIKSSDSNDQPLPQQPLTDQYDAEVVTEWYDLIEMLTTDTEGYTPPVAARAYGYIGVALYEGVVEGMPQKYSLSGKLKDMQFTIAPEGDAIYHWPTIANAVLADMTRHFYATTTEEGRKAILQLEEKYGTKFLQENGQQMYDASVLFAAGVTEKIIDWSVTDGGHESHFDNHPQSYVPPAGVGFWVPTGAGFLPALQPYWGSNRPFLVCNIDDTQPEDPPPFSEDKNSVFYQRALEVYTMTKKNTQEHKTIAEFWADEEVRTSTTAGHSIAILNQLVKEKNLSLDQAAEAYAKLGIGLSDAFVSCWKTKYSTLNIRPITYINEYIDADWVPIIDTPPFPEYTSGHSVQAGAFAEIMTSLFGEDHNVTDRTVQHRTDIDGTPRTYNDFYEMAEEIAISRLYGGVHYRATTTASLEQGYQIGEHVMRELDLDK